MDGHNSILLRIASQVQLAAFHFGNRYASEYDRCINVINQIMSLKEYKNDLTTLTEISWDKITTETIKNPEGDEDILSKTDNTFKAACIHVANAVEMLKFEADYKHINYSYAIGQLVLANWIFQNIDKSLADKCREMYHGVELETLDISKFEAFRNKLWQIYLNKYI